MIDRETWLHAPQQSIRDGFGQALVDIAKDDERIVAVSADLSNSIRMQSFAETFPSRYFEVGVAEQNLIGVAAGLAKEGLIAFAGSYAVFSPGRTHDQIRVSVCYSDFPVVVVGGHAGLSVGPDGATHQALEDIAMMRVLPNMQVLVPSDYQSAYDFTVAIAQAGKPAYLRLSRIKTKTLPVNQPYRIGQSQILHQGHDLTLISCGVMVDRALELAFTLEEQYRLSVRVINMPSIKPLDTKVLQSAAIETKQIVTIEEHQEAGGLGSAVAEWLIQNQPVSMKIIGVKDRFGHSGQAEELMDAYGFSIEQMTREILTLPGIQLP
jgi:transketolase